LGGELLLDAEEQIRAAGCSVGEIRDADDPPNLESFGPQ
jgi:hypothetical protein